MRDEKWLKVYLVVACIWLVVAVIGLSFSAGYKLGSKKSKTETVKIEHVYK